ncbi:MAG: pyruvate kinase [Porticoccaceae bacterium]|nr:pyruvate kinase [Porticoccaceae bacterium]
MKRRTKIVATLGPASNQAESIEALITAGVNVFRLNFSHGDADQHSRQAQQIRHLAAQLNTPIGILCDMQGPKVRIGSFGDEDGILLAENDEFRLDSATSPSAGDIHSVYIERIYLDDFAVGDRVLFDDGRIAMQIISKTPESATCRTLTGGILSSHKGINKFGDGLSAKALTDKDRRDIKTAAALGCDYLAISFVRCARDIEESRTLLSAAGSSAHIIAKIERAEAIDETRLSGIIEAADGLMVARGDLGVEIGDANLVAVQKHLIEITNSSNKIVITATQMMESMIKSPVPSRAEVFDVANAVLDGTDAVMLSAEAAVGDYPVETVEAMTRIIEGAEKRPLAQRSIHRIDEKFQRIDESIAMAAMYVANHLESIAAIVCMTETGFTPRLMSRINSSIPIYARAQKPGTCEIITLYKGVSPIYFSSENLQPNEVNQRAIDTLRMSGALTDGDLVLITNGRITNIGGHTNSLIIVRVGEKSDA